MSITVIFHGMSLDCTVCLSFTVDQHAKLDFFYSILVHETTVRGKTCRSTRTHCPDHEATGLCS